MMGSVHSAQSLRDNVEYRLSHCVHTPHLLYPLAHPGVGAAVNNAAVSSRAEISLISVLRIKPEVG